MPANWHPKQGCQLTGVQTLIRLEASTLLHIPTVKQKLRDAPQAKNKSYREKQGRDEDVVKNNNNDDI